MAEEAQEGSTKMKWLALTPQNLTLAVLPDQSVCVQCHFANDLLGLAENTGIAVRMSPAEAKEFAHRLLRKAEEAERSSSRQN